MITMAIVQKARATELTFGELAHQMFQSILSSSRGTKRIDIVFDVYMKFLSSRTGKYTRRSEHENDASCYACNKSVNQ